MASLAPSAPASRLAVLVDALNGPWHKVALRAYLILVLSHWAEHILQAIQIFALGWPRPQARGALGMIWPWLVSSESMHYAYALAMLAGLFLLRPAFTGESRRWWDISLGIQVWHHFEHLLLLGQAVVGANLLGQAVPTSIAQFFFPRVELHLLYNGLVFLPMVVAMYYHVRPSKSDRRAGFACTCAAPHSH